MALEVEYKASSGPRTGVPGLVREWRRSFGSTIRPEIIERSPQRSSNRPKSRLRWTPT